MTNAERRVVLNIVQKIWASSWAQRWLAIWGILEGMVFTLCALWLIPMSLKACRQWRQLSCPPKSDLTNLALRSPHFHETFSV